MVLEDKLLAHNLIALSAIRKFVGLGTRPRSSSVSRTPFRPRRLGSSHPLSKSLLSKLISLGTEYTLSSLENNKSIDMDWSLNFIIGIKASGTGEISSAGGFNSCNKPGTCWKKSSLVTSFGATSRVSISEPNGYN